MNYNITIFTGRILSAHPVGVLPHEVDGRELGEYNGTGRHELPVILLAAVVQLVVDGYTVLVFLEGVIL